MSWRQQHVGTVDLATTEGYLSLYSAAIGYMSWSQQHVGVADLATTEGSLALYNAV